MTTPRNPSDRDPRTPPDGADGRGADDRNPPEVGMRRGALARPADDPRAALPPSPDQPAARPREFDPLTAFLPESAIRERQAPLQREPPAEYHIVAAPSYATGQSTVKDGRQDASLPRLPDPPSIDTVEPSAAVSSEPALSPADPVVYLTGALRVTSRPVSGSGSSSRAARLLWAASVAIIGVASVEFVGLGLYRPQRPGTSGPATGSAVARVPPASVPTVEVPRIDSPPPMRPAVKEGQKDLTEVRKELQTDRQAGQKDRASADPGRRLEEQAGRPQVDSASRPPVPLGARTSESAAGPTEAAPALPLREPPPPVATNAPVPELPAIELSPLVRPPAPPAPAAPAAAVTPAARVDHRAAIQRVLDAYTESYDRLDAPSAALIWRGVDTRALAHAFSALDSQDLSLHECNVSIDGTQATAVCRGELRYVRRVGPPTPRVVRGSWTIDLERDHERWVIANVRVR